MFGKGSRRGAGGRRRARKVQKETEPDRILQLKECCDMLLAGGYFRARISTLSPFDKVVGGLVWSITAANVGVDVDILFEENSTIGQRIALSEAIVRALIKMKAPEAIQANQIQGLDYPKLFPLLRWLVMKVIETRRLTGDLVRMRSVSQFGKEYTLSSDQRSTDSKEFVADVMDTYKPVRKLRKRQGIAFATPRERTEATLLEYGEKLTSHQEDEERKDREQQKQQGRRRLAGAQEEEDRKKKEAEEKRKQQEEEDAKRQAMLQAQMSAAGDAAKVSGSSVGKIVSLSSDQIREASEQYDAEMKKQASANAKKQGQAELRQIEALKRKIAKEKQRAVKKKAAYKAVEEKLNELKAANAKKQAYNQRVLDETAKLEEQEQSDENRDVLKKLKDLVMLNETLKQQEQQFKLNCKGQRDDLMAKIARVEGGDEDEETKKMMEIEAIYAKDLAKLDKLRLALAKKNQEIAKISRQIDDIPTRAELLQYERRFVELYELVSEKLAETKKFYEMYNTLEESHSYMAKEVDLLNSIIQGFPKAMKSKQGKEQFLVSFKGILNGVQQSQDHVDKNMAGVQSQRDVMMKKYNALVDKQRKYFKAVKEFQEECYKNEKLSDGLEKLKKKLGK